MANFYEGKKVFIAGGAGLIGQSLIRALVPLGAKIATTEYHNRKIDPIYRIQCEHIFTCDLNNRDWQKEMYQAGDIVFWCAARVGGAKSIKDDPMGLVHYNLELAHRNIQAAVAAEVERFCYVSSSYVYPDCLSDPNRPNVESDTDFADVPLQHYGLGWIKRFMEKLCKAHQLASKTKFALVRPTAVFGPYDNFDLETCHVVPALIRKVAEGQSPLEVWGDGSEQRQFCYVDDLVQGLLLATENYAVAEPINVAPRQVSCVNDVWKTLFQIAGIVEQPQFSVDNSSTWNLRELGNDYYRPVKYLGDKPRVISRRVVNTDKCKSLLGYECKTDLKTGLAKTLEWYKANHGAS